MANAIKYAGIFQQNLDKQMTAKLTSGWMEANAGQVIYASRNRFYIYSLFERKAVDCQADEFSLELVCRYLVAEPEHGTYCFAVFVCKTD